MNSKAEQPRSDVLERLARRLSGPGASTGELARLRRMNPRHPEAAFGLLAEILGADALKMPPRRLQRWALVVHCLALARGRHRSQGAAPFGRALAQVAFGELRLQQLLRADLDLLFGLLPRITRRLSARSLAANWWAIAMLVLNVSPTAQDRHPGQDAGRHDPDPNKAEQARLQIARDYVIAADADASATN